MIGLNAAIIDAGVYQIVAMVKSGIRNRILIIDTEGSVFNGLADLTIEGKRLVARNAKYAKLFCPINKTNYSCFSYIYFC